MWALHAAIHVEAASCGRASDASDCGGGSAPLCDLVPGPPPARENHDWHPELLAWDAHTVRRRLGCPGGLLGRTWDGCVALPGCRGPAAEPSRADAQRAGRSPRALQLTAQAVPRNALLRTSASPLVGQRIVGQRPDRRRSLYAPPAGAVREGPLRASDATQSLGSDARATYTRCVCVRHGVARLRVRASILVARLVLTPSALASADGCPRPLTPPTMRAAPPARRTAVRIPMRRGNSLPLRSPLQHRLRSRASASLSCASS